MGTCSIKIIIIIIMIIIIIIIVVVITIIINKCKGDVNLSDAVTA